MDPISLILSALAVGAGAAAKDTASQAVKDAYSGLRTLVLKHFEKKPEAQMALQQYEKGKASWKEPLQEALIEVRVEQDEGLKRQAEHVLKLVNPQQTSQGKYNVQINGGSQGPVIGDHAHVEQHFGKG
jgi:hypothetical protein